jgi:hypothetical protein
LSPDLEDDAERIGTEQPLADLFEILERIEMRRAEKKLGLVSKIPQSSYKSSSRSIIPAQESKTQHFVPSQPVSLQSVTQQIQLPQLSQSSQPYYGPQPSGTYQTIRDMNIGKFIQWITGEVPEFVPIPKPDLPAKPVIKKVEVDSDDELANLTQRQLKIHVAKAVKKAVKLQHRCSICNKTGHNSRNCPKNKKKSKSRHSNKSRSEKKGKINLASVDSNSESSTSSSDNGSNSSSDSESGSDSSDNESESGGSSSEVESMNVNISKVKKKSKKIWLTK